MESNRKQVDKDADRPDGVYLRTELAPEAVELLWTEDRERDQSADLRPDEADEHRSQQVRQQQTGETDLAQGSSPTRVPGGETEKSIEQEYRHSDCSRSPPAQASSASEHVDRRSSEGHPSEQVKAKAAAAEHWVHWPVSVFDFQAAENDRPGDYQRFEAAGRISHARRARLIFDAAENGSPSERDLPSGRYAKLHASKDGCECKSSLISLNVCISKVQLDAAKNRCDISA